MANGAKKYLDDLENELTEEEKTEGKKSNDFVVDTFVKEWLIYERFATIGLLAGHELSTVMGGVFMAGIACYRKWLLEVRHIDVEQLEGRIK